MPFYVQLMQICNCVCYFCVYKLPAFCITLVCTYREIFEISRHSLWLHQAQRNIVKELHKLQQPKTDMYIYVHRSFLYSTDCEDMKLNVIIGYGLMCTKHIHWNVVGYVHTGLWSEMFVHFSANTWICGNIG